MLRLGDDIVISASDLTAAASCEWALMRRLDAKLGKNVAIPEEHDAMLERTAALGDVHERKVLDQLEVTYGPAVVIERPAFAAKPDVWRAGMNAAAVATLVALEERRPLVFQGAFFDGVFQGFSDFLVLAEDSAGAPAYEVWDSKLARHAKITAILQTAAYVDQLQLVGIPVGDTTRLILGDGTASPHRITDVVPVYRHRRQRLLDAIAERIADSAVTPWNDPRYAACGRCATCAEQVESHQDVLLVAGISLRQRSQLRTAGVTTIDELAAAVPGSTDIPGRTFGKLRDQAALQVAAREHPDAPIPTDVFDSRSLDALPAPDAGDVFFDFEGDPLYEEKGFWGIDYLFGIYGTAVNPGGDDPVFLTFWAENLAQERQALIDFVAFIAARRAAHPGMHVYHYASYEKTHLLSLAARHQVHEDDVDDMLRDGLLVDLYPTVRRSIRVGAPSYSIKALEPLYMGEEQRTGTKNAADSVDQFAKYEIARDDDRIAEAARIRADIIQYNRYDCRSTMKLRDWLLARRAAAPTTPDEPVEPREPTPPDPLAVELFGLIADVPVEDRTPAETAVALAAAAVDYYRRENKTFWQEHFARLEDDEDDWISQRGVVALGDGGVEVVDDWHRPTAKSDIARTLRLTGAVAPGTRITVDDKSRYLVYDAPYPLVPSASPTGRANMRLSHNRTTILAIDDDGYLISERLGEGGTEHDLLPLAWTPSGPLRVPGQKAAIAEWASRLLARIHELGSIEAGVAAGEDAALDILVRRPPRGGPLHVDGEPDDVTRITSAAASSLNSYIAVQGPPGAGKTFTGSRVIARLIADHGWKIGVVSQGHATVENMLDAVVEAGVPADRVGKSLKDPPDVRPRPWTVVKQEATGAFLAEEGGRVLGGTAWTFTNRSRVGALELDLLVIDEAGQFSLANTIAVSTAAKRLLLLGDPQQLPQVTQGTHPEPVDTSALGWLSLGHDVLPAELGYFLHESWRMVPEVCAPVSRLSYGGELVSITGPEARTRHLAGVEPGLHPIRVQHSGNDTSSIEETDAVVALVDDLLGRLWTETEPGEAAQPAPLREHDIIVVAPYNAQVDLIRARLRAAGHPGVEVGSVDKFQGREAPVSIVSLGASSADVPRGIEFLLMPNRLNVAISRAKWAAYLVHSPALADHLPTNLANLELLGKFIRLVGEH